MLAQKTPISLMNELCKSNNVVPEYEVVEESGPPHEKTFKVQLNLPNVGTYEGIAKTIKSAKHKAAEMGLESCGLTKPDRKPKQNDVKPSVKLNSLAMKLGKFVQYQDLPFGSKHPGPTPVPSNAYSQYGGQYKSYGPGMLFGRPPTKMTVSVKVGEKEYFGEGYRRKEARHNAAQNALNDLMEEYGIDSTSESAFTKDIAVKKETSTTIVENGSNSPDIPITPIKSEISQVYEIASRQKLKIDFEVISSTGPPHNRMFVTTVTVGELKATGEGASKKASKHEASVKILSELMKLPPPVSAKKTPSPKGRLYNHGGYGKKSVKELDPSLNPISLLGQLRQRRKESLPVYTLIAEEGVRNKEFTIQVVVDTHTAKGSGANKKEAKKNAAEAMLVSLGVRHNKPAGNGQDEEKNSDAQEHKYLELISACSDDILKESSAKSNQPSPQFTICSVKVNCLSDDIKNGLLNELISNTTTNGNSQTEDVAQRRQTSGFKVAIKKGHFYSLFQSKKTKQGDGKVTGEKEGEGRQLPPGLLPILPEMATRQPPVHNIVPQSKSISNHSPPVVSYTSGPDNVQSKQSGPTITVLNRAPGAPVGKPLSDEILQNGSTPSMKKLEQLAESGGFQVHYQDSTQENEQYLAVVTVSTVPQLICRGFGTTLEQAFEHAAANALVPLLQPPSGNGQVTSGAGQRNMHQSGEESSGGN